MMNSRLVYTGIFLVGCGLIGFGLYLQHAQGLEPCPMCILQRYAFVAIGAIALAALGALAWLHGTSVLSRWVKLLLLLATAIASLAADRKSVV